MEAVIFIGIQRRGIGLYWEHYQKIGTNPLTEEVVSTMAQTIEERSRAANERQLWSVGTSSDRWCCVRK